MRQDVRVLTKRIERYAKVNRDRNNREAILATGRFPMGRDNLNATVLDGMPKGDGTEVTVTFFRLDLGDRAISLEGLEGDMSLEDLEKKYASLGLVFADPRSLAAVNEDDTEFADSNANCTFWKDAEGNWCCATFICSGDRRRLSISRISSDDRFFKEWNFAGLSAESR